MATKVTQDEISGALDTAVFLGIGHEQATKKRSEAAGHPVGFDAAEGETGFVSEYLAPLAYRIDADYRAVERAGIYNTGVFDYDVSENIGYAAYDHFAAGGSLTDVDWYTDLFCAGYDEEDRPRVREILVERYANNPTEQG